MSVTYDRARLDDLKLSIEPDAEQQQEITRLERKCGKKPSPPALFDDLNDPDPDGSASMEYVRSRELFRQERNRNARAAAIGERNYAQRSKAMNSHGFRS